MRNCSLNHYQADVAISCTQLLGVWQCLCILLCLGTSPCTISWDTQAKGRTTALLGTTILHCISKLSNKEPSWFYMQYAYIRSSKIKHWTITPDPSKFLKQHMVLPNYLNKEIFQKEKPKLTSFALFFSAGSSIRERENVCECVPTQTTGNGSVRIQCYRLANQKLQGGIRFSFVYLHLCPLSSRIGDHTAVLFDIIVLI